MPYILVFFGMPFALSFVTIVSCMVMLFWSVRTQELRSAKWSSAAASGRNQKRVFIKSMLYISAFLVAWIPCIIGASQKQFLVLCIFAPLHGVLNVLIYTDMFTLMKEGVKAGAASIRQSIASSSFRKSRSISSFVTKTSNEFETERNPPSSEA